MITTVTPNPSLDRTLHLSRFVPGHVNRATATMVEPSGKGVNVALALHGVGVLVRAVLPVGGGERARPTTVGGRGRRTVRNGVGAQRYR
jgi:1-phosphofructokinase